MPAIRKDLRQLAREYTPAAVRQLSRIMVSSPNHSARVAAAIHLLDRGWGKAPHTHELEAADGGIEITVRHIVEKIARGPRTIEHASKVIEGTPIGVGKL